MVVLARIAVVIPISVSGNYKKPISDARQRHLANPESVRVEREGFGSATLPGSFFKFARVVRFGKIQSSAHRSGSSAGKGRCQQQTGVFLGSGPGIAARDIELNRPFSEANSKAALFGALGREICYVSCKG